MVRRAKKVDENQGKTKKKKGQLEGARNTKIVAGRGGESSKPDSRGVQEITSSNFELPSDKRGPRNGKKGGRGSHPRN